MPETQSEWAGRSVPDLVAAERELHAEFRVLDQDDTSARHDCTRRAISLRQMLADEHGVNDYRADELHAMARFKTGMQLDAAGDDAGVPFDRAGYETAVEASLHQRERAAPMPAPERPPMSAPVRDAGPAPAMDR